MRNLAFVLSLALVVASPLAEPGPSAQPQPGDIVVVDIQAGGKGAVFIVNPITGMRRRLTDFSDAGQGPLGVQPFGVAIAPGGGILVVDRNAGTACTGFSTGCGALFSVNPITGGRTIVSDFGNAGQGATGLAPYGVAVGGGQILVMDPGAGFIPNANVAGALFSVAGNGDRTVISDFTDVAKGPQGARPSGVARADSGEALVADPLLAVVFRVDSGAGTRSILTNFNDSTQGPSTAFPVPVAVTPDINDQVLVVDQLGGAGAAGLGTLFSVHAVSGFRTVISDFTTTAQGPLAFNLFDVRVTADNEILVVDLDGGTNFQGSVLKVDRSTGQRDCVSDLGSAAQGPLGLEPSGLAIIPGVRPPGLSSVAAVLPASRSVPVGSTATAFVTIINTGATVAKAVGITVGCRVPLTFSYQTTDPATNALTGTVNTPVDIPPGGVQTYVIALTPTAPFAPTDLGFNFGGDNTARVDKLIGINTLLLSAATIPTPDIVALAATLGNDGIVDIPGPAGTGVFAVATVNVGVGGPITVSGDTGGVNLPVSVQLCQTDPGTGNCISAIGPSVSLEIDAGATPTFAVFVAGSGIVAFDPAKHRIRIRFRDAAQVTRGETSVAPRTL